MKLYFSETQRAHRPQQFMVLGRLAAPVENPDRLQTLAAVLQKLGLDRTAPADHGLAPILAVHDAGYIDFLATGYAAWMANANAGPEILPNTHAYRGPGSPLAPDSKLPCTSIVGRAGWYVGDLEADGTGKVTKTFRSRFNEETFAISPGPAPVPRPHGAKDAASNPAFAPVHTFHVGIWFNSPADAARAGCLQNTTPFNGEHTAGIQFLNTSNFGDKFGPLRRVQ